MHRSQHKPRDLAASLARRVIGQPAAIEAIVPYVRLYEADLAPEGRPVGVFLLLGPTGTGKTKTVEALAQEIHGDAKNLLKIDCGEFQLDHEVAKLIGAPPGYLGHRETHPMISQQKLEAVTSQASKLSIVLFDEVEKAAPSLQRLMLGMLDRANLHLGDNTVVNLEDSLIFLTSNLGAKQMQDLIAPRFGFEAATGPPEVDPKAKIQQIARNAVRRHFSPEFVNRIDVMVTYSPLTAGVISEILGIELDELQRHIERRLGERAFRLDLTGEARSFLVKNGVRPEYGARELKRTIHRHLTQPIAGLVAAEQIPPGGVLRVDFEESAAELRFSASDTSSEHFHRIPRRRRSSVACGSALGLTA